MLDVKCFDARRVVPLQVRTGRSKGNKRQDVIIACLQSIVEEVLSIRLRAASGKCTSDSTQFCAIDALRQDHRVSHVILVIHLPDVWEPIAGALEASITLDMRNLSIVVSTLVCLYLVLAVFSTPLARPLLWKMAAVCAGDPAVYSCLRACRIVCKYTNVFHPKPA